MAVLVRIARGHNSSYPFKTIGAAEGAIITGRYQLGPFVAVGERAGADQPAPPGELPTAGAGEHPAPLHVDAGVDEVAGRCSVKYFKWSERSSPAGVP